MTRTETSPPPVLEAITVPEGHPLARLPAILGAVGGVALLLSALLGLGRTPRLYHACLTAWLFFLSLGLGGLFFVLVQHATRAGWSVGVRRLAEHVAATLPALALLALLLVPGLGELYPWARPEAVAQDPLLQHKRPYLNLPFFALRAVVFLALWSALAWWYRRRSLRQDETGETQITRSLQTLSGPALVVFGASVTFAAFDWVLGLEPHWYSTIFGVYFFSGAVVGILALLIVLVLGLQSCGLLAGAITVEHLHDLGKLLFGFTVFWAYIAFSQCLLIWYASLPEETLWYAHRLRHGWETASWSLALGHFALPFLVLLPRSAKRRRGPLLAAALWLLAMHYLDLYWLVMPAAGGAFKPQLLDLSLLVALGGLFLAALLGLMRGSALVPIRDPRLSESLGFENF